MTYDEQVPASRWLQLALVVAALGAGARALRLLRSDETEGRQRFVAALRLLAGAVGLVLAIRWFGSLRVHVGDSRLRVAYGPIGRTLDGDDIQAVEVERYRWLPYGGWGIRYRLRAPRRDQAWSVPFVPRGARLRTGDGREYFVSSRQPEALAAAVRGIAGAADGDSNA